MYDVMSINQAQESNEQVKYWDGIAHDFSNYHVTYYTMFMSSYIKI